MRELYRPAGAAAAPAPRRITRARRAALFAAASLVVLAGFGGCEKRDGEPAPLTHPAPLDAPTAVAQAPGDNRAGHPSSAARQEEPVNIDPARFNGIDLSKLTAQQTASFVQLATDAKCDCDCPQTLAGCLLQDDPCPRVRTKAMYIMIGLTQDAPAAEIVDALNEDFTPTFCSDAKSFKPDGAKQTGPAGAPVTVVLFSDFQCPFCALATAPLHKVKAQYGDRVNLMFKQFPLSMHPDARPAAIAAEAAARQGKFWEMHDNLFLHQDALNEKTFLRLAAELRLDVEKFAKDLADPAVAAVVDADRAEGEAAGVKGTPTIFINGRLFNLPRELISLRIDDVLEPKSCCGP